MNPDGTVNWAQIFITLLVRFTGVFVVLAILQMGVILSSKIIRRFIGRTPDEKPPAC